MKMKRITAVVLILSVLCVGFGVWGISGSVQNAKLRSRIALLESNADMQNTDANVSDADANLAAAEFDGGMITVGEARVEYNRRAYYYEMLGMDEAEFSDGEKQDVLEGLVEDAILRMKAQELGLYEINDDDRAAIMADVQADFDAEVEYYMSYRYDESKTQQQIREETIAYLSENGITLEGMAESAEQDYWRQKLHDSVTADTTVSEEELYAFYEKQVAADEATYASDYAQYEMDHAFGRTIAWNPEGIRRVEVVTVPFDEEQLAAYNEIQTALSDGDSTRLSELDGLYRQLLPTAQSLQERARQGEAFAELNAEMGDAYASDGEIYVSAQSSMYSEDFRNAAMALANVGDISDPIYTDSGISILRYAGDVPSGAVAFETIREQLRESCIEDAKSSRYNTQVFMWIQDANVKYYPERL